MNTLLREIAAEPGAASCPHLFTYSGKLVPGAEVHALHGKDRSVPALAAFLKEQPGVLAARVVLRHGSLFGRADELLVAVAADDYALAGAAMLETIARARSGLERAGIVLR